MAFINEANQHSPQLLHLAMRDGIRSWLVQVCLIPLSASLATRHLTGLFHLRDIQGEKAKTPSKPLADDAAEPIDHASRLRPLLMALVSFPDSTPKETVEELVSQLLVVAHHPRLSSVEASFWIEMLIHANVSPDQLIASRLDELLESIWVDASLTPSVSSDPLASAKH